MTHQIFYGMFSGNDRCTVGGVTHDLTWACRGRQYSRVLVHVVAHTHVNTDDDDDDNDADDDVDDDGGGEGKERNL